jgi:hypothetical protein
VLTELLSVLRVLGIGGGSSVFLLLLSVSLSHVFEFYHISI